MSFSLKKSFFSGYKYVLVAVIAALPFIWNLQGDFVFDDSEAIGKNKDVTTTAVKNIFLNDFWGTEISTNLSHKSYRPLTTLSFRLNYILSGYQLKPTHFKITNLLCHITCCLLVYPFNRILLKARQWKHMEEKRVDVAFLSTLLFAVHPVHTEVVSGIVGRADMLAAICFLLSFMLYHRALGRKSCISSAGAVCLGGIAMLFKESGITVLGVFVLYELAINRRILSYLHQKEGHKYNISDLQRQKTSFLRISFLGVCLVLILLGRWFIMGGSVPEFKPIDNPAAFAQSAFTRVMTFNYIYFLNFLLMVWPQWLCFDWSMGCVPLINSVQDYRILFVLIFYTYFLMIILYLLRSDVKINEKRNTIMALAILVLPFLPASNLLFPVGFVVAERVLYMPSIGYCLIIGLGIERIFYRFPSMKKPVYILFFLVLLIFGLRSYQRSFDWQNEYRLFTSGLAVCPLNAKVRYNVAKVADANNDKRWALEEYKEAIRLNPEYYQAMNNLGNLLKSEKKYAEAERYIRMAISHKSDFPAAWMNLGIVLANTGRYKESQEAYLNAIKYRRKYPDCFYNLGNLYLEMKEFKFAIKAWQEAIHQKSDHVLAWTNLLALLDNTGQIEEAIKIIPTALASVPEAAPVVFAIANIYGKAERYLEAEALFKKALELFGDKAKAVHYGNLGVLYHRWKKYEHARGMYKKALHIDPTFHTAAVSLRKINNL